MRILLTCVRFSIYRLQTSNTTIAGIMNNGVELKVRLFFRGANVSRFTVFCSRSSILSVLLPWLIPDFVLGILFSSPFVPRNLRRNENDFGEPVGDFFVKLLFLLSSSKHVINLFYNNKLSGVLYRDDSLILLHERESMQIKFQTNWQHCAAGHLVSTVQPRSSSQTIN